MFKIKSWIEFKRTFVRTFSRSNVFNKPKGPLTWLKEKDISIEGYLSLIVPITTFALGTWQVQRKKGKLNQIRKLRALKDLEPVELPYTKEEIKKLEYRPVRVRGHFLHDKELYRGPRWLLPRTITATYNSMITGGQRQFQGFLVITPFKLADRDQTILINRGWVYRKRKYPSTRMEGQIEGVVEIVGIVRLSQRRPLIRPPNNEKHNKWYYRDIKRMAAATGASPIYLDATNSADVPGGPIGGQTRYMITNRHGSYVMTWYSLFLASCFLWYRVHILKNI